MFGFGSLSHILVVLILALIFIGPKQLPEVARSLGRMLNELRRASNMFTSQINAQFDDKPTTGPMPVPPQDPSPRYQASHQAHSANYPNPNHSEIHVSHPTPNETHSEVYIPNQTLPLQSTKDAVGEQLDFLDLPQTDDDKKS